MMLASRLPIFSHSNRTIATPPLFGIDSKWTKSSAITPVYAVARPESRDRSLGFPPDLATASIPKPISARALVRPRWIRPATQTQPTQNRRPPPDYLRQIASALVFSADRLLTGIHGDQAALAPAGARFPALNKDRCVAHPTMVLL